MSNSLCILVIEDEKPILNFLKASITSQGYRVLLAENGTDGLGLAASNVPDLVILDLGLPDIDGIEVINRLREWLTSPIIVLSARGREQDKVDALDAGADDYITKPFGIKELFARIRVAIRHKANSGGTLSESARFCVGDLTVDLAARRVFTGEEEVHLTPIEYRLLSTLVRHAGKVLLHRFLLKEVWGPGSADQTHYLRVFMATLRRKIERDPARPRYLLTEQGVGYRLVDE